MKDYGQVLVCLSLQVTLGMCCPKVLPSESSYYLEKNFKISKLDDMISKDEDKNEYE